MGLVFMSWMLIRGLRLQSCAVPEKTWIIQFDELKLHQNILINKNIKLMAYKVFYLEIATIFNTFFSQFNESKNVIGKKILNHWSEQEKGSCFHQSLHNF